MQPRVRACLVHGRVMGRVIGSLVNALCLWLELQLLLRVTLTIRLRLSHIWHRLGLGHDAAIDLGLGFCFRG